MLTAPLTPGSFDYGRPFMFLPEFDLSRYWNQQERLVPRYTCAFGRALEGLSVAFGLMALSKLEALVSKLAAVPPCSAT